MSAMNIGADRGGATKGNEQRASAQTMDGDTYSHMKDPGELSHLT